MTEIFKFCDNASYNLRSGQVLERRRNRTNSFDVESISVLGTKIWAIVPENLKQSTSFTVSRKALNSWMLKPVHCPCWLCKTYVQNVGFN